MGVADYLLGERGAPSPGPTSKLARLLGKDRQDQPLSMANHRQSGPLIRGTRASRLFSALRRNFICPGMILTGVYWPLRVVSSILDAADNPRLICLIRIGEFFDAFVDGVRDLREALSIPRLPSAVRAYLPRIAS